MSQIEPYPLENYPQTGRLESGQVVPQGMTDEQASHVVPIENTNAFTSEELQDMACTVGGCGVCGRVVNYSEIPDRSNCKATLDSSPKWKPRLLQECIEVITGDRNRDYGEPWENHECTAEIFRWWIKSRFGVDIAIGALDVCMFNDLQKSSRLANSIEHWDSWKDKAGYCGNAGVILDHNAGK